MLETEDNFLWFRVRDLPVEFDLISVEQSGNRKVTARNKLELRTMCKYELKLLM